MEQREQMNIGQELTKRLKDFNNNIENTMTDKAYQYYIDKDKELDVRIDSLSGRDKLYVSIYNDRTDASVVYTCNVEELRGLADFLYSIIGENK